MGQAKTKRSTGQQILKYLLRAIGGILLLFLIGIASAWIYISNNKSSILKKINIELNSRIRGKIFIGDVHTGIVHTFPKISVELDTITIRDSLWSQHRHDLLRAEKVYLTLSLFKLIFGHFSVDKLIIENASVYFYTDSTGYSNNEIFRSKPGSSKNKASGIPSVEIKNSTLIIDKKDRNKLFSFDIGELNCIVHSDGTDHSIRLATALSALVHSMIFNKEKGSFLEEKKLEGKFTVRFNLASKILQFEQIPLEINDHSFVLTGKFFLNEAPAPFTLAIQTENVGYKQVSALLTPNIRQKLDKYVIVGKINDIYATLDGTEPENPNPIIHVSMTVRNNGVVIPIATFTKVDFKGSFTNQWQRGAERGDENSAIIFKSFSGTWQNILLKSDTITIINLKQPFISCDLRSDFNAGAVNNIVDDKVIGFTRGKIGMNIHYKGPIAVEDSAERNINGSINLDSISLIYAPANFPLTNCSGKISFKDKDMFIDQFAANASNTQLSISGGARNLFSLVKKNAENLDVELSVSSPKFNLADFIPFLNKKTPVAQKTKKNVLFAKTASKIMDMLADCDAHLQVRAEQLVYKKFFATNVSAAVTLANGKLLLQNASLSHAGGSLMVKGFLVSSDQGHSVFLHSNMQDLNIGKLFYAFDNFGQTAITEKNINGNLNANINLTGLINEKATIDPNSLKGNLDFSIEDGELINFAPVEKISQVAFKKRDFSDIHFAQLMNKFEIDGTRIRVNRMEIRSTVLTMFVEGIYDVKNGTDLSIQVPLSNLKEVKEDALVNRGVNSKTGISLHLRAKTGDDGQVKITWDPFKKALKETRKKSKV